MVEARRSMRLPTSAARVWQAIGGFNALPEWHPAIESSELSDHGRLRTLRLVGGGRIVERLEEHDDSARLYRYRIVESPLPIEDYVSTLAVHDDGPDGCTVDWSGRFATGENTLAAMKKAVDGIYESGLESLRRMFGG